jgi:hypothetical protein
LKRAQITPKRRIATVAIICITCTCLSIHRLVLCGTFLFYTIESCWYIGSAYFLFVVWQYDTTFQNYVPSCLIFLANILILVGMGKAKRAISKTAQNLKDHRQEQKVILSLMLISFFYIIFMLPASISFSYIQWITQYPEVSTAYVRSVHDLVTFFDEFSMFNYSLNFLIYGSTLPFYRRELNNIFGLKRRK